MTCNPYLPERQDALLSVQKTDDIPDLCDHVFRMKLKIILKHLKEDEPLEKIHFVSVIEFQNRGLALAHIIFFLDHVAQLSLQDPTNIDKLISAEIPPATSSQLRELVLKHMIHDPCNMNRTAGCMREGECSKSFPKPFRSETAVVNSDYYVSYRRQSPEEGNENEIRTHKSEVTGTAKKFLNNSWVSHYSPELLRKFHTHMNLELCISRVGSIKYLFTYVCKSSDLDTFEIFGSLKNNQDANT